MSGDFSRITFDPSKHYTQVLQQQGRVQMDADWNEAQQIAAALDAAQTLDVIGPNGAKDDGFRIHLVGGAGSTDFMINPGRAYVQGAAVVLAPARCKVTNDDPLTITVYSAVADNQPFRPGQMVNLLDTTGAAVGDGGAPTRFTVQSVDQSGTVLTLLPQMTVTNVGQLVRVPSYGCQPYLLIENPSFPSDKEQPYVAYLDVWHRIVTALEDPNLADVALGGADTAVRTQQVWQVKVAEVSTADRSRALAEWEERTRSNSEPRGQMMARRPPTAAATVHNQLYRVEIQSGNLPPVEAPLTRYPATPGTAALNQIVVETISDGGIPWATGQTIRLIGQPTPSAPQADAEAPAPDSAETPGQDVLEDDADDGGATDSVLSMLAVIADVASDVPGVSQTTLTLTVTLPAGSWTWTLQRLVIPQPATPVEQAGQPVTQVTVGRPYGGIPWDGGQTVLLIGTPTQ